MKENTLRLLSGIIYVIALVGSALLGFNYFSLLWGIMMLISIYEAKKLIQLKRPVLYVIAILLFYLSYLQISYVYIDPYDISNYRNNFSFLSIQLIVYLLTFAFIFTYELLTNVHSFSQELSKYFLLSFYVIMPFNLILYIPFFNNTNTFEPLLVIGVFILVWMNDTGAYIIGKKFGKNKLLQRVSPNKTIEGLIGGIIATITAAIAISYLNFGELKLLNWLIIAVIVSIFGVIGDLIESKLKRDANVKDSSNLIPGHGGFLDRLDSIIFIIPFVFSYIYFLYI